jgi:hypothetical protein
MRPSILAGKVIAAGDITYRVALMFDDVPRRFFDKAERDRQHALRRIQRRRSRSIAYWNTIPWLIPAAVVLALLFLWQILVQRYQ